MVEENCLIKKTMPDGKIVEVSTSKLLMTEDEIKEEQWKYDSLHKFSISSIMDAYNDFQACLDFK